MESHVEVTVGIVGFDRYIDKDMLVS
ncbi:protein of unknown function [Petrocella atlantisensis]|uniref:Uncharacterized protein n=1 Tax=Petrocella atlantisensis TaxID=2173034 RepID=A0A3P7NZT7_9FIRM|nr:protein of unknown function [Petrocella atlantisensis]